MAHNGNGVGKRPWYTTHVVRDWIAFGLGSFLVFYDAVLDSDHDLDHSIAILSVGLILMGFASASRLWHWTTPNLGKPKDPEERHE